jgi:endonuclease III
MAGTDWAAAIKPLLKKYGGRPHPLEHKNVYQLVVMVILSAQDSDRHINAVAPPFFMAYPTLSSLARAAEADLLPFLSKVRGHRNKINWILSIASKLKDDRNIPLTMEGLTALPGIGRKSANVIMREAGVEAQGIMVDLHVVRVAPRLGITKNSDPKKIEADLMAAIPKKLWGDAGMAISYLGREICRPSHPQHEACVMSGCCEFYLKGSAAGGKKTSAEKPKPAAKRTSAARIPAKKKAGKPGLRKK